jgi:Domain of unknown function (DUF4150)
MSVEVYANGMEIACKAASGQSTAAFPDTCLTPPPPPAGPQPLPYPNTAYAKDTTNGTKTVMICDEEVMRKDQSTFKTSTGDEAATKSQGMGVVTHTIQGEASFIVWSMNVKFEDQNVDRHLDLTIHNEQCNPANAPQMAYRSQKSTDPDAEEVECGELGTYAELNEKYAGDYDRDHVPSKAALKERARQLNKGRKLTEAQATAIENGALCVCIPRVFHSSLSPTYGARGRDLIKQDAGGPPPKPSKLSEGANRDTEEMLEYLKNDPEGKKCVQAYRSAARQINSKTNDEYDDFLKKCLDWGR